METRVKEGRTRGQSDSHRPTICMYVYTYKHTCVSDDHDLRLDSRWWHADRGLHVGDNSHVSSKPTIQLTVPTPVVLQGTMGATTVRTPLSTTKGTTTKELHNDKKSRKTLTEIKLTRRILFSVLW